MKTLAISLFVIVLTATSVAAQSLVFVVRHAERADTAGGAAPTMGGDPDLSAAGLARAESLAALLKDGRITAIFATEYKRTQQTAAPLAKALGVVVTVVTAKDPDGLVNRVKASSGNVLVVGHANTVPDLIKALGVETPVSVGDSEYDNLFVVMRGEKPAVLRLHYR